MAERKVVTDNDARLTDSRAPTTHSHAEADVTGLTAALAAKQPVDSDLTAIAALTTTSFGRGLLALADAAALLSAAGAQASDATLTALAGLATGANKLAYSTGTDTFSQTDLTAAGRALIDDADAAAQLTTLGVSSFIQTLLDDTTAATARTTLGITAGISSGIENGQPGLIAPTRNGWTMANNALTAQRCFLTRFVPSRDLAVTKIGYIIGSAGGAGDAVDLGIYNSGLTTKLGSTGAITPGNSTTGIKVGTLTGTVNLTAGTVYYAAFVGATGVTGSTTNATFFNAGINTAFGTAIGTFESGYKDVAANTLPSSIATPIAHETQGPVFAIRES